MLAFFLSGLSMYLARTCQLLSGLRQKFYADSEFEEHGKTSTGPNDYKKTMESKAV